MPPFLVPILAAVSAALPAVLAGIALLAPFVLPVWWRSMKASDRKGLVAALKGAADKVGAVARATPMTWDDQVAAILRLAADEGAKVEKDEAYARSVAESLAAKMSDVASSGLASSLVDKVAKAVK